MTTPALTAADGPELLETAAEHSTANVPRASPGQTVGVVLAGLAGNAYDSAAVVAVCRRDRLAGLVTIERLLAAEPDRRRGRRDGPRSTDRCPEHRSGTGSVDRGAAR
ncbi:MAG TPA: hypothetical protein VFB74_15595 [Kribbellaceae bacterium]|nr:hypothetical protein [Kribbellaceae bacterium]